MLYFGFGLLTTCSRLSFNTAYYKTALPLMWSATNKCSSEVICLHWSHIASCECLLPCSLAVLDLKDFSDISFNKVFKIRERKKCIKFYQTRSGELHCLDCIHVLWGASAYKCQGPFRGSKKTKKQKGKCGRGGCWLMNKIVERPNVLFCSWFYHSG